MNTKTGGFVLLVIIVAVVAGFSLYSNDHARSVSEIATSTEVVITATTTPDMPATPAVPPTYHKGDTVTVTAHVGQSVSALGETITPTAVVDDSRCPTDVQCIWAGTVHVSATIQGGMGTGKVTFELGKTVTTEVNSIVFTSVAPAKNSKQETVPGEYVFTFTVTRR